MNLCQSGLHVQFVLDRFISHAIFPLRSKYHIIVYGESKIVLQLDLVEEKNFSTQLQSPGLNKKFSSIIGQLIGLFELLFGQGIIAILGEQIYVLEGLLEWKESNEYDIATITKNNIGLGADGETIN